MRPRITLATFRRIGRIEETMIRAMMPRVAAVSEPLPVFAAPAASEMVAHRDGSRLVKAGWTLAEVVRG